MSNSRDMALSDWQPLFEHVADLPEFLFRFVTEISRSRHTHPFGFTAEALDLNYQDRHQFRAMLERHGYRTLKRASPLLSMTSDGTWAFKRAQEETQAGHISQISIIQTIRITEAGIGVWKATSLQEQCGLRQFAWNRTEYLVEHRIPEESILGTFHVLEQETFADWRNRVLEGLSEEPSFSLVTRALSNVNLRATYLIRERTNADLDFLLSSHMARRLNREIASLQRRAVSIPGQTVQQTDTQLDDLVNDLSEDIAKL